MDKDRKRGIRIAQKGTYRHHERDNYAKPRGWRYVICLGWDDHPRYKDCPGCRTLQYWRTNGPDMDNGLAEYLVYGGDVAANLTASGNQCDWSRGARTLMRDEESHRGALGAS